MNVLLSIALIITLIFTFLSLIFKFKHVLILYVLGNIVIFSFLGYGSNAQAGGWFILFSQIPALIPSAVGILIGKQFQPTIGNKLKGVAFSIFSGFISLGRERNKSIDDLDLSGKSKEQSQGHDK
ncbi:hypothetical protein KO525_05280 [Psychrosphaera sp. B3R10]|uniref:hypothetical protein n=1 Tax=unclassified Psychrosphaera TaxID=2641570 RepID=UPI001C08F1BB|nr:MULTISPECIES: hypothetical protein [unclassified Psychrosphaera]MBU2881994.1 hypothetical protein [Psychrosphaera sp. I2R16]MBU2988786.1 hypothetical protein [Psychrosphaera sp. B3R10]